MPSTPQVPGHMKALRLTKFNQNYELRDDVPVPQPGNGEVLVRVHASSFCHTDYQVYEGTYKTKLPVTPSHEPAGIVVALGPEVDSRWRVGQHVGVINFRNPCGTCPGCRWYARDHTGQLDARYCENKTMSGITADGGFAEYMVAATYALVALPEGLEFKQAAPLMCAGATVWNAIREAGVRPQGSIAIIGIGGLGLLGVQFAKALGYKVAAVDTRANALALSSNVPASLKPDVVVDSNNENAEALLSKMTDGIGCDAAIVCTDSAPAAEWALKSVRPRGVVMPLGLPDGGYKFDAFALVFREIVVKGSLHSSRQEIEKMMKVVDEHGILSHLTEVAIDDAETLPERVAQRDFEGRLVVII